MGFVHDHVTWFHGNVHCSSIMPNNFQRPRIVQILCHIDNGRAHKREPIHVRSQNSVLVIHADSVQ
jgi:hypothetical protein